MRATRAPRQPPLTSAAPARRARAACRPGPGDARVALSLLTLVPLIAGGAEVERFELDRSGEHYSVRVTAAVAAPFEAVWGVVTDYGHLKRLSPAILEGEVLAADGQDTRVRSLTHLCALIFCKDVRQVQRIRQQGRGAFEASTEPEGSDLRYGQARWRLTPAAQGTDIRIQFDLEPAFWIPPLVGPLAIQMALREETLGLVQGIERAAREDGGH